MKKNLLKLGALAVALVVLFAACAQPTDEAKSSTNKDVIIRLLLDRPEHETLDVGDTFQIRVGQNILSPARLVSEEVAVTTTTPVLIDTVTLEPLAVAGGNPVVAYPAGTYTIKRLVWRSNSRADGTGETGTNNKASIPLNRPRASLAAFLPTGATADQNSILMAEWLNGQVRLKTKQPAGHVNGSLATDSLYDTGAGAYNTGTTAFALIPFAAGQEAHVALAATTLTPYYTVTSGVRNYVGTDDLNAIAGLAAIPAAAAPTADYTNDTIKILAYHLESNENVVTGPKSIAFIGRDLVNSEWWTRAAGNDIHTILEDRIPTAKYFETGVVRITNGVVNIGQAAAVQEPGGVPKVVTTDSQYYVDIVLINKTPAAKEFGSTLKSSFSGYIELEILPSSQYWNTKVNPPAISGTAPVAPATWGGMDGRNYYMYTKDRHGFNSWNTAEGKWNTGNDYVKKVSLKPGINEIRLSYFSQGEGDVEFK